MTTADDDGYIWQCPLPASCSQVAQRWRIHHHEQWRRQERHKNVGQKNAGPNNRAADAAANV